MKKWIYIALLLTFVCANPVLLRADEKKSDKAAKEASRISAVDNAKQERDILLGNINALNNQELRVTILQQMLNEEVAKLRNLEAVFADRYKLDVEKFRKGSYRYDDKLGKIVEQPASAEKK